MKPLKDRILFEPEITPEKVGGLFIPDAAREAQQTGHVRAVGDKCSDVKVGDKVIIRKHPVSVGVTFNGRLHKILPMHDVLALYAS